MNPFVLVAAKRRLMPVMKGFSYGALKGIYNAFFHPLRSFPGPKLWSTTFLFRHMSNMRGQLDWSLRAFHEKYGEVVRFSPEELSFSSEQAWKDIHCPRDVQLIKDPTFYNVVKLGSDGAASIFNADQQSHPRVRKQLAHAFSERALRDQEPLMKAYVDLLMEKLKGVAAAGTPVDIVEWYNFTTFDLIGDLAIGKSFRCLNDSKYHSWVSGIWKSIKIGPYIRTMATYTDIQRLMRLLAPASIRKARQRHERYVLENTQERLGKGIVEERKDFLSYILKNRGEKDALTDNEIAANCGFLILAGSETTATALSGVTYYLLKSPKALQKIAEEVRNAFTAESEIDFVNASARLPYTLACLTEGLRIYPPGPTLAPRRTPKGRITNIAGYQVPGWVRFHPSGAQNTNYTGNHADAMRSLQTIVGVHALTASHSEANFYLPDKFIPERWLTSSTTDPSSAFYKDCRSASQPFSLGPRNCLGKSLAYNEMRVILARLLWNFDLELCAESEKWDRQCTYTLWEKPPLMCRLRNVRQGTTGVESS